MKPPVAPRKPHTCTHHGITLVDHYHWLKDPGYPTVDDPEILAYLEAENAYFETVMEPRQALIDTLYEELEARQNPEDYEVPFRDGDYMYQWRFEHGDQYRTWVRWPADSGPSDEQIILDEPALAEGLEYFRLGGFSVSPDGRYLAWSTDTDGSERFTLKIKDIASAAGIDVAIPSTIGSPVFSRGGDTLFYLVVNESWRPYEVRAHRLGTPVSEDRVVYTELDESFFVALDETQSRRYVLIGAGDHVTSEVRYLAADEPAATPALIAARRSGHQYDVDHRNGCFYIRTNDTHKNFRLVRAPESEPAESSWETVIAPDEHHYLRGHLCLADWVIVQERVDGLDEIRVLNEAGEAHTVAFPEATHTAGIGNNAMFETDTLRLGYQSMVTPATVFDYGLTTRELVTRKVQTIPSGYDGSRYRTQRLLATARDGAEVPVSIVYRDDFVRDGTGPLYLYGYGAYGHAVPPGFSTARLSLLDRGFAFAIAHIRGGDDLGYHWYEAGKLAHRTNTFNDFVDVAQHLIDARYTSAGRIAIAGGSAGGELMGAVVNQAPALWGAVAAHVPFVDVLNTMLDASLPLTPIEWPEWGNPIEDADAFELIHSYSPYDRLEPGDYPPILVTAGLNDPRVTYWEPAKYVARLRHVKTDDDVVLLKTNMGAGHGGRSGRFEVLYETAEEYAFILVALRMTGEERT